MEILSNKSALKVHRCIISTGSSSSYLHNYTSDQAEDNTSVCYCSKKEDICRVDYASNYDVFINYSDESMDEVIYDLFNFLIPQDVHIHVISILDKYISSTPKHIVFFGEA